MDNIGIKENLIIEFKSDLHCLPDGDIIDAVVAFANTDGGELYLGVEDSGEITGLHDKHKDIMQLSAFIANKTVPPIAVRTEIIEFEKPVLKISVPKMTCIVASSNGKIQRRRIKADGTPENVPMYPYEMASRLSSLNMLDYSAQAVPDSEYSDLDPVERERLRNIIRTYRGEISLLELSDEELDKALRFVTMNEGKLVPTFCGLLLIGRREAILRHMPTAESSVQVLSGTDVKVNESFYLPILAAFEKINEIFTAWNNSEEMDMGLYRLTIPDYDTKAFREALVNAFCHRDYSVLGRVLIQITDTGMTISNPGGFVEGITADNLIDADPHGRNPVLADAMKRIGLAERTGRGIDRIYEGSLFYGRQVPDYSQSNSRNVSLFIAKDPTDKEFIRMVSAEQQRMGRNFPIYSLLILNLIKDIPKLTIQQISEDLRMPESRIRVSLEALVSSGIAEAGGSGRGRYYMLSSRYYKKAKKTAEYVRQKNIYPIRHSELVLELLKKKGDVCRADVIDLLHVTPPQAYRVLAKLVDSGKILKQGSGAGTRYILKK